MAIELNFIKSDNASWGFRLTGGAEYDVPLTVIKVNENSIAENAGLQINDIIVRVNETPMSNLTHVQAHDVLLAAGNELTLAIRRGEVLDLTPYLRSEEEHNEEVEAFIERKEEEMYVEAKTVHFEQSTVEIEANVCSQQSATNVTESVNSDSTQERKWSTFLQKPKCPKPAIKKQQTDQPKVQPYRVIIKKQPKKKKEEETHEKQDVEIESKEEDKNEDIHEDVEIRSNTSLVEEEICIRAEIHKEEEIEVEISEENSAAEQIVQEIITDKKRDSATERMLEQKLLEIQEQLQALARLPSTIQTTIDTVTQQLASIVSAKDKIIQEDQEASEDEKIEETEVEAETLDENSITENEEAEHNLTEESCLSNEKEDSVKEEVVEETQELEPEDLDPEAGLTEEEKELRRIEREKQDKEDKAEEFRQRRLEQRPTLPLKPLERPIILPGGRRWSQPDDACPSSRHSKMTDEKICDTIETYSEVITGKTKGESNCYLVPSKAVINKKINFLKYQPPPKNLDYLKKSDVYKLVHDLEPPVKGISSRACKILAEQDYYREEGSP